MNGFCEGILEKAGNRGNRIFTGLHTDTVLAGLLPSDKEVLHMDKTEGSMQTLSALQITADTEGLDAQSKVLLYSPEVLAVILKETVSEYRSFSCKEIMGFIEQDSFSESTEVSPGRTNSLLRGDNPEFVQLNEKTSLFDLAFRAKNPLLSHGNVLVNLHIDVEPQKNYRPGYPIEKRGIYYLARRLSSASAAALTAEKRVMRAMISFAF